MYAKDKFIPMETMVVPKSGERKGELGIVLSYEPDKGRATVGFCDGRKVRFGLKHLEAVEEKQPTPRLKPRLTSSWKIPTWKLMEREPQFASGFQRECVLVKGALR